MTIKRQTNHYLPGDKKPNDIISEIIRVDHSGEYGAKKIYQGQLLATKHFSNNHALLKELKHMYEQECIHLDYFEKAIQGRKIRPSFLLPMWSILGFVTGYISGVFGKQSAMTCTTSIEDVISIHYYKQLKIVQSLLIELQDKEFLISLQSNIKQFMSEELEHLNTGIKWGAEDFYGYFYCNFLLKIATKTAISIAKKI